MGQIRKIQVKKNLWPWQGSRLRRRATPLCCPLLHRLGERCRPQASQPLEVQVPQHLVHCIDRVGVVSPPLAARGHSCGGNQQVGRHARSTGSRLAGTVENRCAGPGRGCDALRRAVLRAEAMTRL